MNKTGYSKEQLKDLSYEQLVDTVLLLQQEHQSLEQEHQTLEQEHQALEQEHQTLKQQYQCGLEEIQILKQKLFGRKTEKHINGDENQITLEFNEAEAIVDEGPAEEPKIEETITYTRKKRVGKRDEDLKDLPAEIQMHELGEEELNAVFGGEKYSRLPDTIYRKLEIVPAQFKVIEHHVAVYKCDKTGKIVRAPHPKEMLKNSIATPSLVASIMNAKYTNALPLYRIEQEMGRMGLHIGRQNMAHWVIQCTEVNLSPVYMKLKQILCGSGVLQADETPVEVMRDGRPAGSKSYMWVYRTSELSSAPPVILYDYQKTRNSSHPEEFLKGFKGVLMCDGFSGYRALDKRNADIETANCFAHARRSFAETVKAMATAKMKQSCTAAKALERIGAIYKEEEKLKGLSSEERLERRRRDVAPLVEAYFAWVKEIQPSIAPSSKTGEGLAYSLAREPELKVFLNHGDVPIDNSASERSIRPFTIARKNFVMINTIHGADASAIVFSLVETAKANDLDVYKYLKLLLTEVPKHLDEKDDSFISELLPWSDSVKETCQLS